MAETAWIPLEMEVARRFDELGCGVVQSHYYYDEQSQSQREIDLRVRAPRFVSIDGSTPWLDVYLTVEAKSSKEKPWILFTSNRGAMHPVAMLAQRFVTATTQDWWKSKVIHNGDFQGTSLLSGRTEELGYSLVRASMNKNTEDVAYAAAMSATRAAAGTIDWLNEIDEKTGHQPHAIAIPVIVTDAPLYKCYLDDDSNVQLSQIDHGTLVWRNRISSKHPPNTIIEVVRSSAIGDLAASLSEASKLLSESFSRSGRR